MGSDATEAALGLLGLNHAFDPIPTVPLKRKQPSSSPSTRITDADQASASSDSISCICGFAYDDGFSIGCDSCSRWCHAACFGIVESEVPDEWQCWVCSPRPIDRDRAVRLQKARQRIILQAEAEKKRRVSPGVERRVRKVSGLGVDGSGPSKRKRRPSIHVNVHQTAEDEHIDIDEPSAYSYLPIEKDFVPERETRDKLRRLASQWRGVTAIDPTSSSSTSPITTPATFGPDSLPSTPHITLRPLSKSSYHPFLSIHTDPSIRPPAYAAHASRPIASSDIITPFISTITPSSAYLSDPLNSYAHLSMPKPFVHLLGPPLDLALDARLAGNQARFVRNGCRPNAVLRPMICSRSKSHSDHRVPRDITPDEEDALTFGIFALRDLKANEEVVLGWEWDDGSVIHHLPALIDSPHIFPPHQLQHFRQQLTSMLHALSSTFTTCACGSKSRDCALMRMAEFIDQQTPPTPSPSPPSAFASEGESWNSAWERSRRPSESDEEREMSRRKRTDLGPLIGVERGFRTRERVMWSGGMTGVEMIPSPRDTHVPMLQEPTARGTHAGKHPDERAALGKADVASGTSNSSSRGEPLATSAPKRRMKDRKGKARAIEDDEGEMRSERSTIASHRQHLTPPASSPEPMSSGSESEDKLPPKMRKGWIHKSYEALRDAHLKDRADMPIGAIPSSSGKLQEGAERMNVDEHAFDPKEMPPPPVPQSQSLHAVHTSPLPSSLSFPQKLVNDGQLSPSIPFSKLSLLSPVIPGPSSYFAAHRRTASPPEHSRLHTVESVLSQGNLAEAQSERTHEDVAHSEESASPTHVTYSPSSESRALSTPAFEPKRTPAALSPEMFTTPLSRSDMASDRVAEAQNVAMTRADVRASPPRESSSSKSASHADESTPHAEDAATLHPQAQDVNMSSTEGMQPPPPPSSTPPPAAPPPPPKVKMSLKDFAAMRKRKRQEDEMAKAAASPVASVVPLDNAGSLQPVVAPPQHGEESMSHVDASTAESAFKAVSEHVPSVPVPGECLQEQDSDRLVGTQTVLVQPDHPHPSMEAKIELLEAAVPNPADSLLPHIPELPSASPASSLRKEAAPSEANSSTGKTPKLFPRLCSPQTPPLNSSTPFRKSSPVRPVDRQVSQEDGEIVSLPALPKAPRQYSPPTHPRSFNGIVAPYVNLNGIGPPHVNLNGIVSPHVNLPSAPIRRPLYPAPHRAVQNTSLPSRPLPSGPRALRALNFPSYPTPPPVNRLPVGSIPRGPSADRERMDWDRDRGWAGSSRGRGRGWSVSGGRIC
ncbi:uncharacterized protein LAESUDRAFT_813759 [Laetiporus sulphureus 93-53]|uniref:PHD-type domain-containing protein n=1 Tax=Laetiporus sulphureus 93-53 TaxID=1314785 RepID=A0A165DLV8_9APHY|nr:uncharacterized protein LAESUDRAFT_813759 [Laetiporus sulphureus 93-53]KZT05167.1 hypothetical protein LAESUDRAFT_813759 [Laetiporus sulphureus 93-53]